MIQLNSDMLLTISISLCILVSIRAFYFRKRAGLQEVKFNETASTLATKVIELEQLQHYQKKQTDFQSDLNQAELTTRLQKPRLSISQYNGSSNTPERYRYIHSLTEKGLTSSDIASILSISSSEAEQLVKLAALTKQ